MPFSSFLENIQNKNVKAVKENENQVDKATNIAFSIPQKQISKERKAIRFISNRIDDGITIIFVLLLLIGLYFIYDSAYVFYNASATKVKAFKPDVINAETLIEVGEDCVAWIELHDSSIDYPIMQGDDNNEYLNKAPDGSYALAGSIFLDSRNAPDFTDDYSLVYGHNVSGTMFGNLTDWADKKYFNEHLTGTLTVGDIEYDFNVFAYATIDTSDDVIFNFYGTNQMNFIKNNAINYNEPKEGRLVVLSTCKSPTSSLRNILCGTIIEKTN